MLSGISTHSNSVSARISDCLCGEKHVSIAIYSTKGSLSFDGIRNSAIMPGAIRGEILYFEKWASEPEIIDEI